MRKLCLDRLLRDQGSLCGPASIDGVAGSGHLPGVFRAEESGEGSDVFGGPKFAAGLLLGDQGIGSLVPGNALVCGNDVDLFLDKGGEDPPWADGVDCDPVFGVLEGGGFGEADDAVLGSHVGGFVD